jgi:DNA-binding LacI/PurR family transcriptional regulator
MGRKIPDDISIVSMGVDLSAFKHMTPPMTSIDEPLESICRRAVQMLISRIEDTRKPRQTIQFAPKLHDRGSAKKIRS